VRKALEEVQQLRISAFRDFAGEVASGAYPQPDHCVDVDDATFDAFRALIE
jgi:3-methyl-2-oxobutanoate hydroxymethyltransferase